MTAPMDALGGDRRDGGLPTHAPMSEQDVSYCPGLASVIIPSYNHEKYIGACIESALAQTYQPVEIIVVDDGSTDATPQIARTYTPSVRLVEQANRGTQAARNTGIRASSGEFVALLDSDDVWLPWKLERQIEAFRGNTDVGLVYSYAYGVGSDGAVPPNGEVLGASLSAAAPALDQLLVDNPIPTLTAVIRRACLEDVGLFDTTLIGAGDRDLWLRIATRWGIVCVPEPLALYRTHDLNTTWMLFRAKRAFTERIQVLNKAFSSVPRIQENTHLQRRALAQAYILGGECEAWGGNAQASGARLAQALSLDPELVQDSTYLIEKIAYWAGLCTEGRHSSISYRRFCREFFRALGDAGPYLTHIRRSSLSAACMASVFALHRAGDTSRTRSLLLTGVLADFSWLANPGVWSIALEAFLGHRVATRLRQGVHRCHRA